MQSDSVFYFAIFCVMLAYSLIKPWLSNDKAKIWSPITMISLTFLYYVVKPSFGELDWYGANFAEYQSLFYITLVIFFACVLFSFKYTRSGNFNKWNEHFSLDNVQTVAVILFLIALVCYVPFRGFRTTISASDAGELAERIGFVSYFIDLIALFVAACCLAYIGLKNIYGGFKKKLVVYVIMYFTLVMFIVGGFRYRLVYLLLALATTYHLYPIPRKINYKVFVPLAIAAYLLFAVMDTARSYGAGINLNQARAISLKDASKGANESESVCCFSIACTDAYCRQGGYAGFEPMLTAILMPIPRAILPSKPNAEYLKDAERKVGASGGAAFLVVTEAYVSMGIWGVILYGLFMGWICAKFWNNYRNNPDSIGAIVLLALMNGFCYVWISRGYMGAAFNIFLYYVILPFWLTTLTKRIIK